MDEMAFKFKQIEYFDMLQFQKHENVLKWTI